MYKKLRTHIRAHVKPFTKNKNGKTEIRKPALLLLEQTGARIDGVQ